MKTDTCLRGRLRPWCPTGHTNLPSANFQVSIQHLLIARAVVSSLLEPRHASTGRVREESLEKQVSSGVGLHKKRPLDLIWKTKVHLKLGSLTKQQSNKSTSSSRLDTGCHTLSYVCKLIMALFPRQEPAKESSSSLEEGKH